jgi:MOSC domain-containing protein YiiM
MPELISIQVGTPRRWAIPGEDGTFTSAIAKQPVTGPVALTATGLAGDAVADTRAHGGPDQALLAYDQGHYVQWAQEGLTLLGPGAFGENLAVTGLDETHVAIGDRWRIGEAVVVEVSKPRTPCNRLAWRHGRPELIRRVHETGRSGWYLRVLREGIIAAGDALTVTERPHPAWTVRRTAQVMAARQHRPDEAAELARLAPLAADWRYHLARGA